MQFQSISVPLQIRFPQFTQWYPVATWIECGLELHYLVCVTAALKIPSSNVWNPTLIKSPSRQRWLWWARGLSQYQAAPCVHLILCHSLSQRSSRLHSWHPELNARPQSRTMRLKATWNCCSLALLFVRADLWSLPQCPASKSGWAQMEASSLELAPSSPAARPVASCSPKRLRGEKNQARHNLIILKAPRRCRERQQHRIAC